MTKKMLRAEVPGGLREVSMAARRQVLVRRWTQHFSLQRRSLRERNLLCARCFHSIRPTRVQQQSQLDRPLSPAERFRQSWSKPEDTATRPLRKAFTLDELAKAAHPEPTVSRIEKAPSVWLEPLAAEQEEQLRQIEEEADLDTLEALHDVELDFDIDVFEGEITRGYAGSLPLAGREMVNAKQFIKQGSLVETRGYNAN